MTAFRAFEYVTEVHHDQPVLRDHQLHGVQLIPGVTFLDFFSTLLAQEGEDLYCVQFRKMIFLSPVAVAPGEVRELRLSLTPQGTGASVVAQSRPLGDQQASWVTHCRAQLMRVSPPPKSSAVDLEAIRRVASRRVPIDQIYRKAAKLGLVHGPYMKCEGEVWVGANQLLARLELSESAAREHSNYTLHPAMLDGSSLVSFAVEDSCDHAQRPFIPICVDEFAQFAPLGKHCWVLVSKTPGKDGGEELIYTDLQLLDDQGKLIARSEGFTAKQVRSSDLITRLVAEPQIGGPADVPAPASADPALRALEATAAPSVSMGAEEAVRTWLSNRIAERVGSATLAHDLGFFDLGLDSSSLLALSAELEQLLGLSLYPTLLFEQNTVSRLTCWLLQSHPKECAAYAQRLVAGSATEAAHVVAQVVAHAGVAFTETMAAPARVARTGRYAPAWVPAPAPDAIAAPVPAPALWVLAPDAYTVAQWQRAFAQCTAAPEVLWLSPAQAFQRLADNHFGVAMQSIQDWRALPPLPSTGLVLSQAEPRSQWAAVLLAAQAAALQSGPVGALVGGTRHGTEGVTQSVAARLLVAGPDQAALRASVAALQCAAQEHTGLVAGVLLVDDAALATPAQVAAQVLAELAHLQQAPAGAQLLRWHGGQRQQQRLTPLALDAAGAGLARAIPPKAALGTGAWLLTGAAGGLAPWFAQALVDQGVKALALLTRSAPPPALLQRVQAWREQGVRISLLQAEVSDPEPMAQAWAQARQLLGPIEGVLHAAGVTRDARLTQKELASSAPVLAAKVNGTLLLDQLSRTEPGFRHLVLCSSISARLGNIGQADYAFANAWLDAFAQQRNADAQAPGRALSINWPLWSEGGMQIDATTEAVLARHTGLMPLPMAAGVAAFVALLHEAQRPAGSLIVHGHLDQFERHLGARCATGQTPERDATPVAGLATSSAAPFSGANPAAGVAKHSTQAAPHDEDPVVIVGVAGRYPQAEDLDAFWHNLAHGRDCIEEVPSQRWSLARHFHADKHSRGQSYSKWGGFLRDIDRFDAEFFGVTPRDAALLDPQERLFLQTAWHAFEDAGMPTGRLSGQPVGVYVGVMWAHYPLWSANGVGQRGALIAGTTPSSIANRVSFWLNLNGPSLSLDTMCSGSLTALDLACHALVRGEIESALVGGVNLSLHPAKGQFLSQTQMLSPDGRCRAFSNQANGYVAGEGVGALVLKRLSKARADGDRIYARVLSTALNHGGKAAGFTVPNPQAQAAVVRETLRRAGIAASAIGYIEAHGTGTSLGDPIELAGLKAGLALGAADTHCAIGSVKSNIGHLEAAAGVAAITKVLLQFSQDQLAPSIHASELSQHVDWPQCGFTLVREGRPWPRDGGARIAGINAFGAGGSNAHVLLQAEDAVPSPGSDGDNLFALSARTPESLSLLVARSIAFLEGPGDARDPQAGWSDLCHTSRTRREPMANRLVVRAASRAQAAQALRRHAQGEAGVVFAPGAAQPAHVAADEWTAAAHSWVNPPKGQTQSQSKTGLVNEPQWHRPLPSGRMCSLPHTVYVGERHWVGQFDGLDAAPQTPWLHPLLQRNASTAECPAFETDLPANSPWLADHVIAGRPVLPGVASLEMMRAAASLWLGHPVRRLERVQWDAPVVGGADGVRLQVQLRWVAAQASSLPNAQAPSPASAQTLQLSVHSRHEQGWSRALARATVVVPANAQVVDSLCPALVAPAMEEGSSTQNAAQFYGAFAEEGFAYGPALRGLESVQVGAQMAQVRLRTQGQVLGQGLGAQAPGAPPSIALLRLDALDAALQASRPLLSGSGQAYVPHAVEGFECLSDAPATHARIWLLADEGQAEDSSSLAVQWYAADGQPVWQVRRLRMSQSQAATPRTTPAVAARDGAGAPLENTLLCYRRLWVDAPALAVPATTAQPVVVFGSSRLNLNGVDVACLVRAGSQWAWTGEREVVMDPTNPLHYRQLVDELKQRGLFNGAMVHTWSWDAESPQPATPHQPVEQQLALGVLSLLHLIQALSAKEREAVNLVVACRDAVDDPVSAALSAWVRSAGKEMPSLRLRSVACPAQTPVARLAAQLATPAHAGLRLGAQPHQRWRQATERMVLPAVAAAAPWVRQGVYLITGGLGGIGRVLAEHLALRHGAHLVLTSRREGSAAEQAWLEPLRQAGSEVVVWQADVTDEAAMERLMKQLQRRFGRLDGVLHTAGVKHDAYVLRQKAPLVAQTLAAKLQGTQVLDRVTRGFSPAHFVLFSSVSGMMGNPGQSDYSYANEVLNAFARQRSAQGRPTVSINWPLWKDTGMQLSVAAQQQMSALTGWQPMSPDQALSVLERALLGAESVLMPLWGQAQAVERWVQGNDEPPPQVGAVAAAAEPPAAQPVSQPLPTAVAAHTFAAQASSPAVARPAPQALPQPSEGLAVAAVLAWVTGLLAEHTGLKVERIAADVEIEQYGVDSIAMAALTERLSQDLGDLPKTLFFEYPRLQELAQHLLERHGERLQALLLPQAAVQTNASVSGQDPVMAAPPAQAPATVSNAPLQPTHAVTPAVNQIPNDPSDHRAVGAGHAGHAAQASADAEPKTDTRNDAWAEAGAVAIVGLSGRFPQADDLTQFWQNLLDGVDCISTVPTGRWDAELVYSEQAKPGRSLTRWGGFIQDYDCFDASFFGMSRYQAGATDPQERLFLEAAWHCVEDAGLTPAVLAKGRTGVYAGAMWSQHEMVGLQSYLSGNVQSVATSLLASISNRVSYQFNLRGPSLTVDSMCSSTMVALKLAVDALRSGEIDSALVGGVNLTQHPYKLQQLSHFGFAAKDGRCRAFGTGGTGYVAGEGVGCMLLKPLAAALRDGDPIRAVIRGLAVNHGGRGSGYSVPNPQAQAEVIEAALANAKVSAHQVNYVEAHGTGTALGDPIEVAGLIKAYGLRATHPGCTVGSVKSNIGHLEAAAGVAGIAKLVLQLEHRTLVPSLHAQELNPDIDFADGRVQVQRTVQAWSAPRGEDSLRAGLSSFGAGGTNAHLVLEQAPALPRQQPSGQAQWVLLSAPDRFRLRRVAQVWQDWAEAAARADAGAGPAAAGPNLDQVAHTLRVGRVAHKHRLAMQVRDFDDLREKLAAWLQRGDFAVAEGLPMAQAPWLDSASSTPLHAQGAPADEWAQAAWSWIQGQPAAWPAVPSQWRRANLPGTPFTRQRQRLADAPETLSPLPLVGPQSQPVNPGQGAGSPAQALPLAQPPRRGLAVASQPQAMAQPTPSALSLGRTTGGPTPAEVSVRLWRALVPVLPARDQEWAGDERFDELGLDSMLAGQAVELINQAFGTQLLPTVFYQHPSVDALQAHLSDLCAEHGLRLAPSPPTSAPQSPPMSLATAANAATERPAQAAPAAMAAPGPATAQALAPDADAIAVVGLSGRFAGADDLQAFWRNLRDGVDSVQEVPASRWDINAYYDPKPQQAGKTNSRWMGALQDVDQFDAAYFGLMPDEALATDPQQRLALEESWKALNHAGYGGHNRATATCGVFFGAMTGDYLPLLQQSGHPVGAAAMLGNHSAVLSGRIAYLLNLRGPCMTLDTACSSSLLAVHLARRSLLAGECDMALAGGVFVAATPTVQVMSSAANMLSPDGHCKAFDNQANGIALGEGCGVVVLKRFADALASGDTIYGVLRGSGCNQDGKSNGLTAPNGKAQTELALAVYREAGIQPQSISYVEAHGTGTRLGDPIEVEALTNAFRAHTSERGFCAIGSVKPNIGHCYAAAGVASLLKVLLALAHRELPPSLHCQQVNELIRIEQTPFVVNTVRQPWVARPGAPRRAAVSAFGYSGTNVHLVLDEPPQPPTRQPVAAGALDEPDWLLLSARNDEALVELARSVRSHVATLSRPEQGGTVLADLLFTLQGGREAHDMRLAVCAPDVAAALAGLDAYLVAQANAVYSGPGWQRAEVRRRKDRPDAGTVAAAGTQAERVALWLQGAQVSELADPVRAGQRRVALPMHPMQKQRHWPNGAAPSVQPSQLVKVAQVPAGLAMAEVASGSAASRSTATRPIAMPVDNLAQPQRSPAANTPIRLSPAQALAFRSNQPGRSTAPAA